MNTQTATPLTLTNQIRTHAKEARPTGAVLEEHLQDAHPENLSFLATYLKAEVASRKASARKRLITTARLPSIKTLENYDWSKVVGYRTLSVSGLGLNYRFQVLWCRSSQLMAVPHLTGPCWRWCWRASW